MVHAVYIRNFDTSRFFKKFFLIFLFLAVFVFPRQGAAIGVVTGPDLTASAITPTTAATGVAATLVSTISNIGNTRTGEGFSGGSAGTEGLMTTYTGAGAAGYSIAFDGYSMWVASPTNNSVTKISPSGTVMTTYAGTGQYPLDIAFDGTNMWTANPNDYSVTKISSTGVMTAYTGLPPRPSGLAFDGINMWVANLNGSVTKISPAGVMVSYTGIKGDSQDIAFDGINMWITNMGSDSVTKVSPTGAMTNYTGTGDGPAHIAFDGTNMWTANAYDHSVTKISPTGTMTTYAVAGSAVAGSPCGIAFDGTNMWATDCVSGVIKISPTGAMTSYAGTGSGPYGIAFDGTNMWTVNSGGSYISVTKIGTKGFPAFFQVDNGVGGITDLPATTMPGIDVSGSISASQAYTFYAPGTYSVRACADKTSSAGGGVVNELDETNNCGPWTSIMVGNLSDLTASAIDTTTTGPVTTLWSGITNVSNVGSTGTSFPSFFQTATGPDGSGVITDFPSVTVPVLGAGMGTTISQSYTFSSPGTYSARACADKTSSAGGGVITESNENNNCGPWTNITIGPDLVSSATSPTSAVTGVSTQFSSIINNAGSASTGSGFSNFFQVATASNGGGTVTDLTSTTMPALATGATANTSQAYTFSAAGTYSVRACADKTSSAGGGVIAESNEGNNCGPWTNVAVTESGNALWSWGYNANGELGVGDTTNKSTPVQVTPGAKYVAISGGRYHSLAIKSDGTLWSWGQNLYGQLGLGDTTSRNVPVQVTPGSTYIAVSAGAYHSLALRSDGTLWVWGRNDMGQLGLGDIIDRNAPAQVTPGTTYIAVATGGYHSLALRTDGTLWVFGWNSSGQLGLGDAANRNTPTQVTVGTTYLAIAAGYTHSLALKSDSTLWSWGANNFGQLGLGDTTTRTTPVQITPGTTYTGIAAGTYHSFALRSSGTLWAWGYNNYSQLGLGDTTTRSTPVQVASGSTYIAVAAGTAHSLALKPDNTLWVWGQNLYGQLGLGDTTNRSTLTKITASANFVAIAAGYNHSLALGNILVPIGSFSPIASCTILFNASTCSTSVAWSIANAVSPSVRQAGTQFSTLASSGGTVRNLTWGSNTFTLYDGTTLLDTKNQSAACEVGSVWSGSSCTVPISCGSAAGTPTATKPTTNLCSDGSTPTVTGSGPWNWTCGSATSCSAPKAGPVCGNNTCEAGENPLLCPKDCKLKFKAF